MIVRQKAQENSSDRGKKTGTSGDRVRKERLSDDGKAAAFTLLRDRISQERTVRRGNPEIQDSRLRRSSDGRDRRYLGKLGEPQKEERF
ncbi:unnamed protein product [Linum trigynum]|uniref:Uncharacterized protein n=1 Tax=Linum trigynum TaxID=586398 RepID=A0AAV2D2Y2_9ROSI